MFQHQAVHMCLAHKNYYGLREVLKTDVDTIGLTVQSRRSVSHTYVSVVREHES